MTIKEKIISAKEASISLASASVKLKNKALELVAKELRNNKKIILKENRKDVKISKDVGLFPSLIKRLELNETKIDEMIKGINGLIELEDPIGKRLATTELDNDLILYKVSVPIGVIGVIFESRPDALVQISCLCIKSGNAAILKGGSEAKNSNIELFKLIRKAIKKAGLSEEMLQLIETREDVKKILKLNKYIDLIIPRGSNKFVKYIMDNTKIPVLGHADGICHVYVDKEGDMKKAIDISYDSKCQYAAVCNAMETLLVHKLVADKFIPLIVKKYLENNVEVRGDGKTLSIIEKSMKKELNKIKKADELDWKTEYNELIISIKVVSSTNEAIEHINKYGSGHTDAIVTENNNTAEKFMNLVDSSSVMLNASTRFSDGFRYGFGAEVGISTNKIHARGPVGLDGLTIYKYKLIGKGQIVKDYTGKNAREFIHLKLKK